MNKIQEIFTKNMASNVKFEVGELYTSARYEMVEIKEVIHDEYDSTTRAVGIDVRSGRLFKIHQNDYIRKATDNDILNYLQANSSAIVSTENYGASINNDETAYLWTKGTEGGLVVTNMQEFIEFLREIDKFIDIKGNL